MDGTYEIYKALNSCLPIIVCCISSQAWLRARAEAVWQSEREGEAAFQRQMKLLKDPVLSVDPAGEDVAIALPIEPKQACDCGL